MKKIILLITIVVTFSSCYTVSMSGSPAAVSAGASIGGVLGSIVGERAGGWNGSQFGALVGTVAGAAVGNAVTTPRQEEVGVRVHTPVQEQVESYYAPSGLRVMNIRFIDDNRNHTIDAEETCKLVFDISNEGAGENFTRETGVKVSSLEDIVNAEAVLLAVKPQMLFQALAPLQGKLSGKLIISIVAGVKIKQIAEFVNSERIVRVMPNTPALVGEGASAYAPGAGASAEDAALVGKILEAVGVAYQVKESDLDAVTGLSGSGPAYVFEFIQALADGGVAEGLARDVAVKLAAQTFSL